MMLWFGEKRKNKTHAHTNEIFVCIVDRSALGKVSIASGDAVLHTRHRIIAPIIIIIVIVSNEHRTVFETA